MAAGPWSSGRVFGPGEVRLALLSLLSNGNAHGYELMSRLEERCGGAYRASAGTIYPTLQQLADEGCVKVEPAGDKKVYALSDQGLNEVSERAREIERIWQRASDFSEWGAFRHPDAAEVLGPALRLVKLSLRAVLRSHGDPRVIEELREIFDEARLRVERVEKRARA